MVAKVFHRLVTIEEALKELNRYLRLRHLSVEEVDLSQARGRVLAEDVFAANDYPPFDRSEVDGFALRSPDLERADEDNPVKLRFLGSVGVGEESRYVVEHGTCVEVATGSVVPRGADAVIPVEYTKKVGDTVYVYRSVSPGENVVHGGSDVLSGDVVALEGTLLSSADLSILAGTGVPRVKVYRKALVGVVSIGSELVEPGMPLKPGAVYDVNSYYLRAALEELGAEVKFYGIASDKEEDIREILSRAIRECDLVITSGGTSAGISDITYRVVNGLGSPGVVFHGLKVRPGKPTFAAVIEDKLVIGLPGFPLSMMMTFSVLVKPVMARLSGIRGSHFVRAEEAVLAERVAGYVGVERLVPVVLRKKSEGPIAYPISYRSGSINVAQLADGFIRVRTGVPFIEAGTRVTVYRLHDRGVADLLAIGSHDYLFSDLIRVLSREYTVKYIAAGSLAGLGATAKGVADIAGVHIFDRDTETYNEVAIKKLGYGDRVALITGYLREVGFVTLKGNPKNITGFRDLLRDDVIFINRNRYSGTRVLVDSILEGVAKELGVPFENLVSEVKGYYSEAKTHSGVALSILKGRADVGLTLRYVALKYGLEFIPLTHERFDIAVSLDSLETPGVKSLINYMRSTEFRQLVSRYPGYNVLDNTGEVILLK